MDELSFTIYLPNDKKVWWTPDVIVLSLWVASFGCVWLFDGKSPADIAARTYIAILAFVITMYYLISSFWKYKPLNGVLEGKLVFDKDSFKVNDTVYQLSAINNLDFGCYDYYGERSQNGRNFNPRLSQGVSNYITFTDAQNEDWQIYFRLDGKHSYLLLAPFISAAVKANKIQFKQAIDLVGIAYVSI